MQSIKDFIVHEIQPGCWKPMLLVAAFGAAYWWLKRAKNKMVQQ